MPRKSKKKVETIKIEGFSADTIKEFAPKDGSDEEDKLWEEYFRGSPNIFDFSKKQIDDKISSRGSKSEGIGNTIASNATAVTSPTDPSEIASVLNTSIIEQRTQISKKKGKRETKDDFINLDSTHRKSEQMVYSVMYRETIAKGKTDQYFSLRKIMRMTAIGSDKTVFNALRGLCSKLSIKMVEHSNNKPIGTLYRVFRPEEIFKKRSENGIIIDINTKRIISTLATDTTVVTTVEDGEVKFNIPYIKNDKLPFDVKFNHKEFIVSLYERYTESKWGVGDSKYYETVKDLIPDIIEAGIIASVLRSKSKINSLAYCEGAINEFKYNLIPGCLGYLREKWSKIKEKDINKKHEY